jgi:L-malate glycosyltransferase
MGGSEKVVYDLVSKIDRNAYEPIIISFSDGPVRELYEGIDIEVFVVRKERRVDLHFVRGLRRILRDENVGIVNAHHFGPLLYTELAVMRLPIKIVYTEHSRWQIEELSGAKKFINRILLAKADALVAISRQIEDYYVSELKLKKDKVHFISNGINLSAFRGGENIPLRRGLGIKDSEKVVGIVANLRPEKNHKVLISAFSVVATQLRNVRLVIVGLDCMDGEVQRLASESPAADRILFLGCRKDIPEILSTFDVFCLPSLYEGMPLTVLEAMASGVPVIGADVLGINEVIKDGENGLLFKSNDEKGLAEALYRLLQDGVLQRRLSRTAGLFVEAEFSLDEKVNEYENLFRSVCRNT